MEFLEDNQIREWAEAHGLTYREPFELVAPNLSVLTRRACGDEGPLRDAGVVDAMLADLAPWEECLVVVTEWSIWPSREDWPKTYAWRGRLGERRSLPIAPGHRLSPGETPLLRELLVLITQNGWDATVLCARGGSVATIGARISHDGYCDVLGTPGPAG